jgi:hypothetical protein
VEILHLHAFKSCLHRLPYRTDLVAPVLFFITPRHGPRRQHLSFSYANRFPLPRERVYGAVAQKRVWYIRLSRCRRIVTALHATICSLDNNSAVKRTTGNITLCISWSLHSSGHYTVSSLSALGAFMSQISLSKWNRNLRELVVLQTVKNFPIFNGNWRFITVFTKAHQCSLLLKHMNPLYNVLSN